MVSAQISALISKARQRLEGAGEYAESAGAVNLIQIVIDPEGPGIVNLLHCMMSSDVVQFWVFFWTVVRAGTIPKFGGQSAALLEAVWNDSEC